MGIPQGPELLAILVVLLLVFGARKVPELARSLGRSAKELRRGFEDEAAGETEATSDARD